MLNRFNRCLALFVVTVGGCFFSFQAALADPISDDWEISVSENEVTLQAWRRYFQATGITPVSWVVGDNNPPPPSSWNFQLCLQLSHQLGDPMIPECQGYFWIHTHNGPQPLTHPSPGQPTPTPPTTPTPTPRQLIEHVTRTVRATGAGLHIQPNTTHILTHIPTIFYTTTPTQTLTTTLFDTPLTVTLKATHFTYNFADGTPPHTTTDPGKPYPHHTLTHTYTQPHTTLTITLTTTWSATITSPYTGHTTTLHTAVTTTETTPPITTTNAHITLTPTTHP